MNFRALLDLVFTRSFWSLETMGKFSFALLQGFFIFILSFLIILPRMLVLILAGVLYFLPECIFRCLPTIATTPVRQSRRYVTKIGQGAEQRIEMRLAATKKDRGSGEAVIVTYRGGLGQKCPLSEFLSVYDILLLVTQDLHYVDIENLGRVSRGVREAVMPQQSIHHRMNVFRKYTCQTPDRESSIAECWVCYKQVCGTCEHIRPVPQARPLFHLENCTPYCGSCYHRCVVRKRPPPSERLITVRCRCGPRTATPGLLMRLVNGSAYYQTPQQKLPTLARTLCRSCNSGSNEDLLQKMHDRAEVNLIKGRNSHNQLWTTCTNHGCDRLLGTGPRWWVCSGNECGMECRSFLHQAWSTDKIDRKDYIIGDQAV